MKLMYSVKYYFRGNFILKLPHKKPVYGLSVNPQNDYVIATAGDDGRILIFDIRESTNTGINGVH
jgi:DDB1- and CUL4-associated factor 5